MVKNEQSKNINQSIRTLPSASSVSLPSQPPPSLPLPMFQTTSGILSQRLIDTNAIDITSLKGQFAWEKIAQSDTYMPVIFRGDTKYFCVRMLHILLPDYPVDVIRRSFHYQYKKSIDLYTVTAYEVQLLNRINIHHSRYAFSKQLFTAHDEIVRISDFLPFYEHLRNGFKSAALLQNATVHTLRQLLPQPQQVVQRSSDFTANRPTILRGPSTIPQTTSAPIQRYPIATDFPRENTPSILRPVVPGLNITRLSRPLKTVGNPYAIVVPSRPLQYPPPPQQQQQQQLQSILSLPNNAINSTNTVSSNNTSTTLNMTPVSLPPSTGNSSSPSPIVTPLTNESASCSSPVIPPSVSISHRNSSSSSISPSTTSSSSKPVRLHFGWLQVNKLYTPYISTSATNHHLYKIPVSLLMHYDLLKTPSNEINDQKDSLLPYEQTLATSQEIELINELCTKQNIKPLAIETKLISLSTFYQYSSVNLLFVKELPINEPKISICKDWASIIQINGGICRLRNIATLHEQTVPFIGNNLLKNFILSSQCLATASLSKPTAAEMEFLQLIQFFSNLSINLRNAQLIDIKSVKKEYNVDVILLFNDKFPLNVLNYQEQGNRSNTSQGTVIPTNSTAPINTIAESTPPPSPPSPPTNQPPPPPPQTNNTSQLPLTSSTNRYYKTIQFHGHSLTAYICSGIGATIQRECVSVKSLCNILYPDSTLTDKFETKMLRLLRLKNINRFRPQNQQSAIGFTRLIDIKDAEKHWDYIEQEMQSTFNDNEEVNVPSTISSVSTDSSKASTVERVENDIQPPTLETSVEINKGEKRPLDEPLDEEDIPVLERINKRARFAEKENNERLTELSKNQMNNDEIQKKRPIKISSTKNIKKSLLPSIRTNKESKATWVRKYGIEDCCIQMKQCDPIHDTERD